MGEYKIDFSTPEYKGTLKEETEKIEEMVDNEEVAGIIETQIIKNYNLHPSNYFAYFELKPDQENTVDLVNIFNMSETDIEQLKLNFHARLAKMPIKLRPYLLAMYANPVIAKSV